MTLFRTLPGCLLIAVSAIACGGGSSSGRPLEIPALEPLSVPAPGGSAHPQLTSSSRGAILSWIEQQESTSTLRFSERTSGAWSEPRTAASGDDWFVTTADVPSVLRLSNGTIVANWYPTTDALLEAYNTQLAYSRDEGATWSPPFSPHHDGTKTQHGFASLLELPGSGLGVGEYYLLNMFDLRAAQFLNNKTQCVVSTTR
jgi:hypothetical protein